MKQTVTIEVDVPDGREFVELRKPTHADNGNFYWMAVIFRDRAPTWQPPAWLKPGWIAMDSDGDWYWYENEPLCQDRYDNWHTNSSDLYELSTAFLDWTPPPTCTDWKQSLRQIPARAT